MTLPAGIAAMARNMRFVRGRAEVRRGIKRLLDGVSVGLAPVVLPFDLGVDVAVSSVTRSGGTATLVSAVAHGCVTGDKVNIRGAVQTEYNGDFTVTKVNNTTLTYSVTGTPATPATGTIVLNNGPEVSDSYAGGIFGACVFSSPSSTETLNGAEWIALFGATSCFLYRDGQSVLTKAYPGGETLEEEDLVTMLQAFDKLFLFRGRELVGSYARKACTMTRSSGTATVTSTGHGFETNDRVCIEGAGQSAYNIEADITKVDANTFTFAVSHAPATPATGTITCRKVKPPLMWDGAAAAFVKYGGGSHATGATYSTMRSTGVACYQNNQIFIARTPIKDEVMISDILDANTYDPLQISFRANAGSDDRIVGMLPFAEGTTLIFGRKSIYRAKVVLDAATGTELDPANSFLELITNEVGCRAQRTLVVAGAFVYFLSDNGVHRLDAGYQDLKVRGVTLPLSDAVADLFENITEEAAALSNAVWFDNRYWLAVPLDGVDAPNVVLVWNALTGEWESYDSYPLSISTLLVSDYGGKRRLFGASRTGKLVLLEEQENGDDPATEGMTELVDVAGELVTRRYFGGDLQMKRWMRVLAGVSLPAGALADVVFNTYDPDNELTAGRISNTGATDNDFVGKLSVRQRGSAADVTFLNVGAGRPVIKSVQVDVAADRPSQMTRTES
jgi:hypothetical protein